jgi:hypothetical protein
MQESKPLRALIVCLVLWGIVAPLASYQFGHIRGMKAGVFQRYDSMTGKIDATLASVKQGAKGTADKARDRLTSTAENLKERWSNRKSADSESDTSGTKSRGFFSRKTETTAPDEATTKSKFASLFRRDKSTTSGN